MSQSTAAIAIRNIELGAAALRYVEAENVAMVACKEEGSPNARATAMAAAEAGRVLFRAARALARAMNRDVVYNDATDK